MGEGDANTDFGIANFNEKKVNNKFAAKEKRNNGLFFSRGSYLH